MPQKNKRDQRRRICILSKTRTASVIRAGSIAHLASHIYPLRMNTLSDGREQCAKTLLRWPCSDAEGVFPPGVVRKRLTE